MDIAIRTERNYTRMGIMGPNNVRFKAHMYMHLQYACLYRVVFVRANALSAFEQATDAFVSRLPASAFAAGAAAGRAGAAARHAYGGMRGNAARFHGSTDSKQSPQASSSRSFGKAVPQAGCYLCAAADHYCNDDKFHPKVDGKYPKVSKAMKAAILQRVRSSDADEATKAEREKNIKDFWSRHSL